MNKLFKNSSIAFCLFLSMSALAQEVTIGSLKYQLNGAEAYVSGYVGEPTDVVIPETIVFEGQTFRVAYISGSAFQHCISITSLTSTGENFRGVESEAFRDCPNLKKVDLVCTVAVWISAFAYCNSLEEVNLTCPKIGPSAFQKCSNLQKVILSDVRIIENHAFFSCSNLKFVDLGNSLTRLWYQAFANCSKLPYIVIPSTCNEFYSDEFSGCSRLQSIIYLGDQDGQWGSNANVYHAKEWGTWSQSEFDYQSTAPQPSFTYNEGVAGFQVSGYELSALEKNAGTYTTTVPVTFANDDMSFTVDAPYTYTIKPATLTAKAKDASRPYGDANPAFSATYSGFVDGEDASVLTSHGTFSTTATTKSDVGTYPIKQTGATAQNYVFEYEDGTLTVNEAPLTMTANDKTMTYGGSVPALDARYEGLKNNETAPVWTTQPQLTTTATPESKAAQYPITISNAVAKNYDVTCHNGTLTVEKAPLTAKVDNKSRLYGDANPAFTLSYTGLKNGETVPEWSQQPSFETEATEQSNVGSYPVSLKNAVAVNYEITPKDGTLTVNKAPLTATPKDYTRKYGDENPEFELVYAGLRNSENQPEWTQAPVVTTSATKGSSVGEYAIELKSGEARNYTIEKGTGRLTITKAPLTIKLQDATRKYGMTNPNFTMAYTGLVNDETEPAWTTYPAVSTTAQEKSDVGDYPITAIGGVLKNYEAEGIAPGVLTVTPASLVVKAQSASRLYFEENPTLRCDYEGFVSGDGPSLFTTSPVLTTTATLLSPVGIYPIEVGGAAIKNYELSYERGQLEVQKRTLTASTGKYTRAYGEENPEFTISYKGFVNDEDESVLMAKPKAITDADQYTDTGVYDIKIANGVAENYAFTYVNGYLTIEKAYQTLSWEQDLGRVMQYEQVELKAEASSGLDVSYQIEGEGVCSLMKIGKKQYLDCYGEGEAVIIATQEGNKNYWQTPKVYKTIKVVSLAGIDTLAAELDGTEEIYDTKGNRQKALRRGVNIVKKSDGSVRKVFVK